MLCLCAASTIKRDTQQLKSRISELEAIVGQNIKTIKVSFSHSKLQCTVVQFSPLGCLVLCAWARADHNAVQVRYRQDVR